MKVPFLDEVDRDLEEVTVVEVEVQWDLEEGQISEEDREVTEVGVEVEEMDEVHLDSEEGELSDEDQDLTEVM